MKPEHCPRPLRSLPPLSIAPVMPVAAPGDPAPATKAVLPLAPMPVLPLETFHLDPRTGVLFASSAPQPSVRRQN